MFRVFRVFRVFRIYGSGVWVFRLMTFGKDQKGDQGGPKMAKFSGGVKPDIFKIT